MPPEVASAPRSTPTIGVVVAVLVLIIAVVAGAWFFFRERNPAGTVGWGGSTFLLRSGDVAYRFSHGALSKTTAAPEFPRAELLPELVAETLTYSSNPGDYQVLLSDSVVVAHANSPARIPGTELIAVRTKDSIDACDAAGKCGTLYSFGGATESHALYAFDATHLYIVNPETEDVKIFSFAPPTDIKPLVITGSPLGNAVALTADPMVPGRLLAAYLGINKDEARSTTTPGVLPATNTVITVCAFDGFLEGTPVQAGCADVADPAFLTSVSLFPL